MARSRRRSPQVVALARLPFNDSADSHADSIVSAGEVFPSSSAAPRSGVHRLLALAESGRDPYSYLRGYGGRNEAPMQAPRRRSAVVRVGRPLPFAGVAVPQRPPVSPRARALDWRAFNALQVRVPERVRFCVQRKQRRETLFALDIAGRRGLGRGGVRRTENSNWSCR